MKSQCPQCGAAIYTMPGYGTMFTCTCAGRADIIRYWLAAGTTTVSEDKSWVRTCNWCGKMQEV